MEYLSDHGIKRTSCTRQFLPNQAQPIRPYSMLTGVIPPPYFIGITRSRETSPVVVARMEEAIGAGGRC